MKLLLTVLSFIASICFISGQHQIGINTTTPKATLDIRGTDNNLAGGELLIATPDSNHFIRFFGGRNLDRNPFLLFSALDTFRISSSFSDFSKFTDHFKVTPDGYVGVGSATPTQKLEVDGKVKIGNDSRPPKEGTIRYDQNSQRFEGFDGTDWILFGNNNYLLFNNLGGQFADRNVINDLGTTIIIPEDGTYIFSISVHIKSFQEATYDITDPDIKYDYEGVLDIIVNNVFEQRLTMGKQDIDRFGDQFSVAFIPGSRAFKKSLSLQAGDIITLESIMRSVPLGPVSFNTDYFVFIDELYLVKVR